MFQKRKGESRLGRYCGIGDRKPLATSKYLLPALCFLVFTCVRGGGGEGEEGQGEEKGHRPNGWTYVPGKKGACISLD